jgi:hypothetical protein
VRVQTAAWANLARRWLSAPVALGLGALIFWMTRSPAPPVPDVPLLETPLWRSSGPLLLRAEANPSNGLLLRHGRHGEVYRYAPRQRTLTLAKQEDWDAANTPVRDCATAGGNPKGLWVDPTTHKLRDGKRELTTAGAHALYLFTSPSGSYAAVLSAEGPATGDLLPFLSGGGAGGRHYHQFVRTEDGTSLGPAFSLGFDSRRDVILGCWSPNERFAVYHDYLMSHLSIVHIDAFDERNPADGEPHK